jgi:predicted ATPase
MRLISFRIKNFRSILDSKNVPFSPDGVTVFVGQNESGKSSVLDALYFALAGYQPSEDDIRIGAELPIIEIKAEVSFDEIKEELTDSDNLSEISELAALQYLEQSKNIVEIAITWKRVKVPKKDLLERVVTMLWPDLNSILEMYHSDGKNTKRSWDTEKYEILGTDKDELLGPKIPESDNKFTADAFAMAAWQAMPLSVRFTESDGALPNTVDIDENGKPKGPGAKAAENFLQIAGIDLSELLKSDFRTRQNTMNRANAKVSEDFRKFWSQTIGNHAYLTLKCEITNYASSEGEKSGMPHLVFWISDGNTQLYPAQRSRGTRWFISFYLQLKASENDARGLMFLLDEPGANLHAKAQVDVLKLINNLSKEKSVVVYSTHSGQLLEYSKLYRVCAVQRSSDEDDSPTLIINAHHLGTASSDTLSPVLSAMGIDFSQNNVIKKYNNVLLEEMSGYYYISAIWRLTNQTKEISLIAATGVSKIEALANMFRGWGLSFIIAVDDDSAGRDAYKSIKKSMFADDDELAKENLVRFKECKSIEDIFSPNDFKEFVLLDKEAEIPKTNGDYLKTCGKSKPVLAYNFNLSVENNNLTLGSFEQSTQDKMVAVAEQIASRLVPI